MKKRKAVITPRNNTAHKTIWAAICAMGGCDSKLEHLCRRGHMPQQYVEILEEAYLRDQWSIWAAHEGCLRLVPRQNANNLFNHEYATLTRRIGANRARFFLGDVPSMIVFDIKWRFSISADLAKKVGIAPGAEIHFQPYLDGYLTIWEAVSYEDKYHKLQADADQNNTTSA